MNKPKKRDSKIITAAEMVSLKEEMRRNDPAYRAQEDAVEAERRQRVKALNEAEQPIVQDLRRAGVEVTSVWDLVNTSVPYPDALPVLLEHLRRGGYPDRVMESLGRALAVRPASFAWEVLRDLYLSANGRGEEEGLAVALAASTTADHLDQLVALLREQSRGDTRIHFLRAIKRVGGEKGQQILKSLRDDPLFGREARALLKEEDDQMHVIQV
jgi:hypothetical protein